MEMDPRCEAIKILHSWKLTWNLKITQLKRKVIFQTSILRFHVNFPGYIRIVSQDTPGFSQCSWMIPQTAVLKAQVIFDVKCCCYFCWGYEKNPAAHVEETYYTSNKLLQRCEVTWLHFFKAGLRLSEFQRLLKIMGQKHGFWSCEWSSILVAHYTCNECWMVRGRT